MIRNNVALQGTNSKTTEDWRGTKVGGTNAEIAGRKVETLTKLSQNSQKLSQNRGVLGKNSHESPKLYIKLSKTAQRRNFGSVAYFVSVPLHQKSGRPNWWHLKLLRITRIARIYFQCCLCEINKSLTTELKVEWGKRTWFKCRQLTT